MDARPGVDRRPGENGSGPAGHRGGGGPGTPGYRLPAPVRERRPALAALAVLLIVGGALASALIVVRSGQRSDYLVIRTNLAAGQRIRGSDLGVASIAGSGAHAIAASRRNAIVGEYTTTQLFPGTLATSNMFTPQPQVPQNASVVGLVLLNDQRPALTPARGDVVSIFAVPKSDVSDDTAKLLIPATKVIEVGGSGSDVTSNGLALSVLVGANITTVEGYAAVGRIGIARLPQSTPIQLTPAVPVPPAGGGTGSTGSGAALRPRSTSGNAQLGAPATRR